VTTVHCPDCLGPLARRPHLGQDGRCRSCRREIRTPDHRRRERERARRKAQPPAQVDAFV
jgi:hypothetical protein